MDGPVSGSRTVEVAVPGGTLAATVWEPEGATRQTPTVLAVHGVTSSHLAWAWVAPRLADIRVIAPDLRGRGRSNAIAGPAGLAVHADDMALLLDAVGVEQVTVVGHSMGGFVSVVFAHRHPDRVSRLLLVDGGLPLSIPAGMDPDQMMAAVLGPTAARLSMRFDDEGAYLRFWREHPAFAGAWEPRLDDYFAYDLVPAEDAPGRFRSATSYAVTRDDTTDMTHGSALVDALAALRHPATLVTVPRGLRNEEPGLYPPSHLDAVLAAHPSLEHRRIDGLNHYTIVMSDTGAALVEGILRAELALV
ncbi:alpha/beta hydrolase [Microbacterium xanthum]|uniref:alpha/beta hydrolase n=1 Tax=Microbacterium xanthum TaxID=3079794 RepID=UPI002AD57693|nr:alpha/beta hydrolase [Microbacterium sp. KSW-48]MDZ8172265.1 alpha/beta hydrolase [Microbacterium sp. KSW-48]